MNWFLVHYLYVNYSCKRVIKSCFALQQINESHVHITVENEVMIKEYLEATLYRRYEDSNNGRFMQKYGVFFSFRFIFI